MLERLEALQPAMLVAALREVVEQPRDGTSYHITKKLRPGGIKILEELESRPMLGPAALR